jgi:antitoxin component YwqK of YwqJK toxin-antitoxin module
MDSIFQLFFIILFYETASTQVNSVWIETHYANESFDEIYQFDTVRKCKIGEYKKYYNNGAIESEGSFYYFDSVACIDCFTEKHISSSVYDTNYILPMNYFSTKNAKSFDTTFIAIPTFSKIEYAYKQNLKVGFWKYYHPNGKIKSIGKYFRGIHIETSVLCDNLTSEYFPPKRTTINKPSYTSCSGLHSYSDLHDGIWEIFNEQQELITRIYYQNGKTMYSETLSHD